jgi:Xaa-Pro aminopeptidase
MFEYIKRDKTFASFEPIVASGINAIVLHYTSLKSVLKEDELLLIDTGAEYELYAGDITRVFPVNGKFAETQLLLYNSVLKVQREMLEFFKPGITINELNTITNDKIARELVELKLITVAEAKNEKNVKKYFPHGLAHFLGLDVHDVGGKDVSLEAGMVLTCEPGIYVPEWKMGIRLEDDILITETGNVNLSKHIPILPEEVEKMMN